MKILEQQERQLHQFEIRTDNSLVKKLLHISFIEIWYSWNSYSYNDTIKALGNEEKPDYITHSQDYEYVELAPDLIQVLYKTAHLSENWEYSRHAKRMSIWILQGNNWQMKYHQGTPTKEFKIS